MSARTVIALLAALAALAAPTLAGCGAADAPERAADARAVVSIADGELTTGDALPRPTGEAVLSMRGVAGRGATRLDVATLDRLPRVRLTVREPFKKRDMTFEGVRLTDLLEIAGAPDDAAAVYMHALDDYHVNLPLAGLRTADAVVATRAGGAPIGLTDGGPIRLVFPDGVQLGQNSDNWIWSIDRLRVR